MSDRDQLTVTVKTSNGAADDITVSCERGWSVFDLKAYIYRNHPVQPPVRMQKVIYGGRLLEDDQALSGLSENSGSIAVHLVISPTFLRAHSLPNPTPTSTAHERPAHPSPPPPQRTLSEPDPSDQTHPWLRYRQTQFQPEMQRNPNPMPMAWPNPYLAPPYNPAMAAQMAQWYQMFQAGGVPPPTRTATYHDVPNRDPLPAENAQREVAPNEQDIELPDDMAVNGGGGGFGLMAGGVIRHRDVIDYLYMLMMLLFMGTIGYFTGSLKQFIIFFVGVAIILLNQGGWFTIQRRQVAPQQQEPERDQPVEQQQQQQGEAGDDQTDGGARRRVSADGEEEEEEEDGSGEGTEEGEEEEPVQQQPQRPGILSTLFVFITSFFTSLLPQQLPELQEN